MITLNDAVNTSRHLAGRVKRYHTWPVIHTQTVAEHEHRVIGIYVEVFGLPRAEVLMWIHQHDSGEFFAGDSPYNAKREMPALKDAVNEAEKIGRARLGLVEWRLTNQEFLRAKVADLLEMWEFGWCELTMGNRFAQPIIDNCVRAVEEYAHRAGCQPEVKRWMTKEADSHAAD